jgi:hypothetical protein
MNIEAWVRWGEYPHPKIKININRKIVSKEMKKKKWFVVEKNKIIKKSVNFRIVSFSFLQSFLLFFPPNKHKIKIILERIISEFVVLSKNKNFFVSFSFEKKKYMVIKIISRFFRKFFKGLIKNKQKKSKFFIK